MKVRTFFLLIGLVVIAIFAGINWTAFTAPTTLSLLFSNIQAPLGLIMLGVTAFITLIFILFSVFIQTSAFLDARRQEKELQSMRDLADRAETSRFKTLQEILEKDVQRLIDLDKESKTELLARIDKMENAINTVIEQSGNSLAAYISELDDKLEKNTGT